MQADVCDHHHQPGILPSLWKCHFIWRYHSQLDVAIHQKQFLLFNEASFEADLEFLGESAKERLKTVLSVLELIKLVLLRLPLSSSQALVWLIALCQ